MGRVSTCQKNCNTIDLRGAQVNNDLSWIRANGIHAKALSEENLKIPIRKWKFKVHFENHIQMPQGAMS